MTTPLPAVAQLWALAPETGGRTRDGMISAGTKKMDPLALPARELFFLAGRVRESDLGRDATFLLEARAPRTKLHRMQSCSDLLSARRRMVRDVWHGTGQSFLLQLRRNVECSGHMRRPASILDRSLVESSRSRRRRRSRRKCTGTDRWRRLASRRLGRSSRCTGGTRRIERHGHRIGADGPLKVRLHKSKSCP